MVEFLSPFQGLGILWTIDPGRRSQTRFALGYHLSGIQPFKVRRLVRLNESLEDAKQERLRRPGPRLLTANGLSAHFSLRPLALKLRALAV